MAVTAIEDKKKKDNYQQTFSSPLPKASSGPNAGTSTRMSEVKASDLSGHSDVAQKLIDDFALHRQSNGVQPT